MNQLLRRVGMWVLGAAALLLAGCGSLTIHTQYRAQGQDDRVQFLILHFTDENLADSLRILTQQQVSAHYLLSDESPPVIYRLVDENRRAWHAGKSSWRGNTQLNASSIGIEIVNSGWQKKPDGTGAFTPYPPEQIDALMVLVKDIMARHQIKPERVLGHSDIAPQRKIDPGASFPWQRLAQAGLALWPDETAVAAQQARYAGALPDVGWFQKQLAQFGYEVPATGTLDAPTRRVIAAFQMRFRPALFDGEPDAHTAALLSVLNQPAPR
jgi:N-acetylmuramoyl-L-alanine amidase